MVISRGAHKHSLSAGIGKSLFLYYIMWTLARQHKTVVWDRLDVGPVLFSGQGVMTGPLEAFSKELDDPDTWCVLQFLLFGKLCALI